MDAVDAVCAVAADAAVVPRLVAATADAIVAAAIASLATLLFSIPVLPMAEFVSRLAAVSREQANPAAARDETDLSAANHHQPEQK